MTSANGTAAPAADLEEPADELDEFDFSPAVRRAWEAIEAGNRKSLLEQLKTQRQEGLVGAMSNVRAARTVLELKEDALEDAGATVDARERLSREGDILQARLGLENNLQTCEALAEELETLEEAIAELTKAAGDTMIHGGRATRRRQRFGR